MQALPVLRLLKRHLPDSRIYWWIDSRLAPLLQEDPDLADLAIFDRKRWGSPIHWPEMWRSVMDLRSRKFDWVLDLQGLARSGAFAWLANGELLLGLDASREGARGFYDVIVRRPSYYTHAVDWYLCALRELGAPVDWNFTWLPERPAVAAAVKAKWDPDGAAWIAMQPGARWPNKKWPVESFAELARQLTARSPDVRVAVLGGPEDKPLGERIAQAAPQRCLDLTGKTSLPEMIEWLRLSRILVTNDTGPMHVAAALGKPVIAIFGPTEPRRTGPYGQLHRVLRHQLPCSPCMKSRCAWPEPIECLKMISVPETLERVSRELAG